MKQKVTRSQIDAFLNVDKMAIAGVSRNDKKFGYQIYQHLSSNGKTIYPVNPAGGEMDGNTCYESVSQLPEGVESILIVTPKSASDDTLKAAINKGIKNIWIQQMSDTVNSEAIAREYNVDIITGKCIFMFAEPVKSIHKFHRGIVKFFGKLPN